MRTQGAVSAGERARLAAGERGEEAEGEAEADMVRRVREWNGSWSPQIQIEDAPKIEQCYLAM